MSAPPWVRCTATTFLRRRFPDSKLSTFRAETWASSSRCSSDGWTRSTVRVPGRDRTRPLVLRRASTWSGNVGRSERRSTTRCASLFRKPFTETRNRLRRRLGWSRTVSLSTKKSFESGFAIGEDIEFKFWLVTTNMDAKLFSNSV